MTRDWNPVTVIYKDNDNVYQCKSCGDVEMTYNKIIGIIVNEELIQHHSNDDLSDYIKYEDYLNNDKLDNDVLHAAYRIVSDYSEMPFSIKHLISVLDDYAFTAIRLNEESETDFLKRLNLLNMSSDILKRLDIIQYLRDQEYKWVNQRYVYSDQGNGYKYIFFKNK